MIWDFDPVAFTVFGQPVRWYGLVYVAGFFLTDYFGRWIANRLNISIEKKSWDNLIFGLFVSGVIGGRLGDIVFYRPEVLWENSAEILQIWNGGMSIHGGIIGAGLFLWYWARKRDFQWFTVADIIVLPLTITLMFGRIANFINGEIVGTPTASGFGVIFPHVDTLLRHPVQLYESAAMGVLAFILGWFVWKRNSLQSAGRSFSEGGGFLTLLFFLGYGVLRFGVEFYKDSSAVFAWLTTGQILCVGMILWSVFLWRKLRIKR